MYLSVCSHLIGSPGGRDPAQTGTPPQLARGKVCHNDQKIIQQEHHEWLSSNNGLHRGCSVYSAAKDQGGGMGAAMGDNMDKMGGGQGQDQWGKGVRRAIDRREIGTSAEIQNTDKADHPYIY